MTQISNRYEISEQLSAALNVAARDSRGYGKVWELAQSENHEVRYAVGLHLLTVAEASGIHQKLYRDFQEILALPYSVYQLNFAEPAKPADGAHPSAKKQYDRDLVIYKAAQKKIAQEWRKCIREPGELNEAFPDKDEAFKTNYKAGLFVLRHMTTAEFNLVLKGSGAEGNNPAARIKDIAELLEKLGGIEMKRLKKSLNDFMKQGGKRVIATSPKGENALKHIGRSPWNKNLTSLIPA